MTTDDELRKAETERLALRVIQHTTRQRDYDALMDWLRDEFLPDHDRQLLTDESFMRRVIDAAYDRLRWLPQGVNRPAVVRDVLSAATALATPVEPPLDACESCCQGAHIYRPTGTQQHERENGRPSCKCCESHEVVDGSAGAPLQDSPSIKTGGLGKAVNAMRARPGTASGTVGAPQQETP